MEIQDVDVIGGAWLCKEYQLLLVSPLAISSRIGTRRQTLVTDNGSIETYQEVMRPDDTLRGHLTFHFKHESLSLEMLSRLFDRVPGSVLGIWIASEPTSQYARRAGFLYEWMTRHTVTLDDVKVGGNYVDVLDAADMVVAQAGVANSRWRVRDNLPGTPRFCPTIRLTDLSSAAMSVNCKAMLDDLQVEFGQEMLLKSAVWLTLRESRSSFQIEGEVNKKDRIERFASVLHHYTGRGDPPLDQASLAMLQKSILGDATSVRKPGIRQSPVIVGETVRYLEVVHYVAPPFEDVTSMLDGIAKFLNKTAGQSSVMRAAVAAFGFVYVHPMADGNGRVHRFLVNDVLRRDGAVPAPLIIPVSGLITRDVRERQAYDTVLETISKPLMRIYAGAGKYEGPAIEHADGISSNFSFGANDSARHAWRFMDFTQHVQYLGGVLERTIHLEMREEAMFLRSHMRARNAIKEVVEMPDQQIDRVIRSIEQNNGVLSGVLAKEIPFLNSPGVWPQICEAVASAFHNDQLADVEGTIHSEPPRP